MTKVVVLRLLLLVALTTLALAADCDACARSSNCSTAHASGPGHHCGGYDKLGHRTECCCGVHQECEDPTLAQQCRCTTIVRVPPEASVLDLLAYYLVLVVALFVFWYVVVLGLDCYTQRRSAPRSTVGPRAKRASHTVLVHEDEDNVPHQ